MADVLLQHGLAGFDSTYEGLKPQVAQAMQGLLAPRFDSTYEGLKPPTFPSAFWPFAIPVSTVPMRA